MTFNKPNPHTLVLYVSQHQKRLRTIVVVLLSLYLIAFAAKLMWRIIPEPQLSATPTASRIAPISSPSGQSGVNIKKIQQLNLFGNATAKPKPVEAADITDAPETRLNLVLTGVVSSSIENAGTAIIENKGSQAVYGLGEKIEGTNATLQRVYTDRVIIKNGIRNETLMLDGIDFEEANRRRAQQVQTASTASPRQQESEVRQLSREAVEATTALRQRPLHLASKKVRFANFQEKQLKRRRHYVNDQLASLILFPYRPKLMKGNLLVIK